MRIVLAPGCFDLFHDGHWSLLNSAKKLGDWLVVAVNDDNSVSALKGDERPYEPLRERLRNVSRHPAVNAVIPFAGDQLALVDAIRPHVLVKGSDYREHQVIGFDLMRKYGGRVCIIERLPESSTTLQAQKLYGK